MNDFRGDLETLVKNGQGIGAREISLRIGQKLTAEEWNRLKIPQILSDYLQEIGEPLPAKDNEHGI